ncbi:TonB-dependent receptor [Campylobacter ureolyticus]|uniref:TonB-dependent receptor domain-containing protein n=1 Tax=Campylobacter ureolyticus TaxID=827 RepID=UPI001FC81961|nr:TonB-dependent receptor [Campylobacter ureolyticus]MCZ6105636.1 TonB-dependent receptor [Campylobacter ureolyticus]MCZ6132360.1 TonB-dependent receptor [Campylobacter ureolyticus]MCZ6158129.1 TonB-dependent receptor [Campylobacter ureolyticus]MCZ6186260.1 TonB-dependent receptor [Campylobacter ureolyticus]GKH60721.1 putative TonB-dependent receptor [Campylobacter ureolyticus]
MKSLTRLSLIAVCFGCLNAAETITLDTIDVEDKELKADKEVYQKAKAVSAREDIATSTQNLDTILRSIPGTFTNQDKSTGTIAPNIRGSQGFGRVNTMIDGVTQTFYSSGADDGRSGSTSQFGATIDPSFIAGVDVERGTFGGKSGVNSLMGSANFRTLGVNDIIKGDKNFGFLGKYQVGDNAYKSNYMGTFAGRAYYDDGFYVGALIGHSHRDISQNYKIGNGIKIEDINKDFMDKLFQKNLEVERSNFLFGDPEKWYDAWFDRRTQRWSIEKPEGCITNWNDPNFNCFKGRKKGEGGEKELLERAQKSFDNYIKEQFNISPFDPNKLKQEINSYITKFEFGDEHNFLTLSFRNLENKIWSRKIEANNYQLNYNFNDDKNIDLNILFAYNETKQKYKEGVAISTRELIADLETKNKSTTFDISNTFKSDFSDNAFLTTTIGLNNLKNSYSKNRHPYELVWFNNYYDILNSNEYDNWVKQYPEYANLSKREIYQKMISGNFFIKGPDNMFGDAYQLGFNKDNPQIDGYRANTFQPSGKQRFFTIYADNKLEYEIFTFNLGTNLVKYDYSGKYFDRANKTKDDYENNEFLFDDYGQRKAFNYSATLSAFVDDLFTPFVSYSKSSRFPTIQELYFSQRTGNIYTKTFRNDLKSEEAKTWQIGFNSFKENLITNKDIFGFKVVYYNSDIKNYIHTVERFPYNILGHHGGSNDPRYNNDTPYIEYDNYAKKVLKKGVELELSYDMGLFYINLAYARQKTNQPTNASDAGVASQPNPSPSEYFTYSHGISKVTMLPKDYGSLDTGVRLMNEKLTIGTRVKYFGKSKKAIYGYRNEEKNFVNDGGAVVDPKFDKKLWKATRLTEDIEKQPFIFDFYVSYEPIENLVIKAEVQNAFDKQYIDPLDTNNDAASQRTYSMLEGETSHFNNYAKGRTAVLSFEYRY